MAEKLSRRDFIKNTGTVVLAATAFGTGSTVLAKLFGELGGADEKHAMSRTKHAMDNFFELIKVDDKLALASAFMAGVYLAQDSIGSAYWQIVKEGDKYVLDRKKLKQIPVNIVEITQNISFFKNIKDPNRSWHNSLLQAVGVAQKNLADFKYNFDFFWVGTNVRWSGQGLSEFFSLQKYDLNNFINVINKEASVPGKLFFIPNLSGLGISLQEQNSQGLFSGQYGLDVVVQSTMGSYLYFELRGTRQPKTEPKINWVVFDGYRASGVPKFHYLSPNLDREINKINDILEDYTDYLLKSIDNY